MSVTTKDSLLTGRELVLATLQHQRVPSVPWVPFAGVHAGKLTGYTATQLLTDKNKLVESLLAVNRKYRPDGQPIVFDLQIEAEILGCDVLWAEKGPPTVASHPLAFDPIVPTRLPERNEGRLPMILSAMSEMKAAIGQTTALYGLITGPFTLASHLRSTELFMDMYENEEYVHELVRYAAFVNQRMTEFYIDAGMDVIAVVDPLVSQISPAHFATFLKRPFQDIFSNIGNLGSKSSFFVCGDATKNIEVMCQTGPDSISIDENINMLAAKTVTDRYNIALGGNIPLASVMLFGNQQDNMRYVIDLLGVLDHHNLILSPGCDMPYDTPVENVVGISQAIREPEAVSEMLHHYHATIDITTVQLPDYRHLPRPLIEVFTIDSSTCAACAYMLDAAMDAKDALGEKIDVVEYRLINRENIARMKQMRLTNVPAMVINGELAFSSIIPGKKELLSRLEKYLIS